MCASATPGFSKDSCACPLLTTYHALLPAGLVTNIINGVLECGQGVVADKQQSRIGYYQRHASLMGVTIGGNLDCANQQPYGQ